MMAGMTGAPLTALEVRVDIVLAGGPEFVAFAGEQPDATLSRCKSCRALIWWGVIGDYSRPHPFDMNGKSHFATCPDAEKWREDAAARAAAEKNQGKMF